MIIVSKQNEYLTEFSNGFLSCKKLNFILIKQFYWNDVHLFKNYVYYSISVEISDNENMLESCTKYDDNINIKYNGKTAHDVGVGKSLFFYLFIWIASNWYVIGIE